MAAIGIVGNGEDKFTGTGSERAINLIGTLLTPKDTLVSGHSPVGGIDIWAEHTAIDLGCELDLKIPEIHQWNPNGYGYRARNLDIALDSDELHVIVASEYPEEYEGKRFDVCYHCRDERPWHVKSGGCWTGKQALAIGRDVTWHYVSNY